MSAHRKPLALSGCSALLAALLPVAVNAADEASLTLKEVVVSGSRV
jgi:hypothetical protein